MTNKKFFIQVTFTDDDILGYLADDYNKQVKYIKNNFNNEFIKKIVIVNMDNI